MVQVLAAKDPAQDVVWVEARARVEAEWADRLQQGRAEIVSVRAAERRLLMLPDSPVTQEAAPNVVQKWQEVNIFFERRIIMPGGDGTGPGGMGPMTGRAAGFCAGYPAPGYANPVGGRGYGGWGRGFRGGGFGRGRGFGWGRAGYGLPAYGSAVNPYAYGGAAGPYAYGAAPIGPMIAPQQELDGLKGQAEYFEDSLDGIKKRIEELESRKSGKEDVG